MKPYAQYKLNGQLWRAGRSIMGLCAAYSFATAPDVPMTERDHLRSYQYARAIRNRMARLGYRMGYHYQELSNGMFWPVKTLDM